VRRSALLLAAAVMCTPLAARADDRPAVPAKARALAERGRAAHDAGDYAGAITAFTQAYVIAPSPALLFNLAQAYRLQGKCDDAELMYQRYLATDPSPEGRSLAEAHLASMERCLHKIALHVSADDATARIAVPAPPAASITSDAPPVSAHRAEIEKSVGVGLTIGGTAALAAALYYAVQAQDAADDVSAMYDKGGKGKGVAPIDQRGRSAATNARILAVGGTVGVVGGIVMYVIGKRDESSPVAIAPLSHGAAVSMRWAF
jgi:tetratricopeptide (TPR) repeat protein